MSEIPTYSGKRRVIHPDLPLKPQLGDILKQLSPLEKFSRLWCRLKGYYIGNGRVIRDHFWLSRTYFTGTARNGTAWWVCGSCGKTRICFRLTDPT